MEKASVSVKIYNSTYALTTSASEEQVLKIAAEVDRRMQELAENKKLLQNVIGWHFAAAFCFCVRTMSISSCYRSNRFWLAFCRGSIYNERANIYFRSGKSDFMIQIYSF